MTYLVFTTLTLFTVTRLQIHTNVGILLEVEASCLASCYC